MKLYNDIERAIRNHALQLSVPKETTQDDVYQCIRSIMRESPDIFWFVHQYHFDKDNGIVSFRYRYFPERCAIIQESINGVVENDFQITFVRTLSQLEYLFRTIPVHFFVSKYRCWLQS